MNRVCAIHTMAVLATLTAACAPSLENDGAPTTPYDGPVVEVTLINQSTSSVRAYLQWSRGDPYGPRLDLGPLRAGETSTHSIPYEGSSIRVTFDIPPQPPLPTGGPGGRVLDDDPSRRTLSYSAAVDAGERITWRIRSVLPPEAVDFWRVQ